MEVSCIIVAGGKSERMGRDKKFAKLKGKYFLEYAIQTAKQLSEDIIISVGSKEQKNKTEKITNLKIVVDSIEFKGPVAGLYEGLKECAHKYAAVLPCDTPLMQAEIFEHMIRECAGYDAVVPQIPIGSWRVMPSSLRKQERRSNALASLLRKNKGNLEPLHAVYKVSSMLKACEKALEENQLNLSRIVSNLKVKYIPVEVFKKYDRNLLTFHNINTRKDLELVKALEWT